MFFKNQKNNDENKDLVKIGALLINTAKIDQDYTSKEEDLIKNLLLKIGANKDEIDQIITDAKKIEGDSNQILDFPRQVKNMEEADKIQIIETLWRIIYSDKDADIYETNLMRRLAGLLYIDNKVMGDIKDKIKKESS